VAHWRVLAEEGAAGAINDARRKTLGKCRGSSELLNDPMATRGTDASDHLQHLKISLALGVLFYAPSQSLKLSTSEPLNLSSSEPLNLSSSEPLNLSSSQPHNLSNSQTLKVLATATT
jgi:hypothetical protein